MATTVPLLKVLISSPSDVAEERRIAVEILRTAEWLQGSEEGPVLQAVRAEDLAPGIGADPQEVINRQLPEYDVFVGIMWSRIGSPTPRALSGTIEEFEDALARWRRNPRGMEIMFFFRTDEAPPDSDRNQLDAVCRFKNTLGPKGLFYKEYREPSDFAVQFSVAMRSYAARWLQDRRPPTGEAEPQRRRSHSLTRTLDHSSDYYQRLPTADSVAAVDGCLFVRTLDGKSKQVSFSGQDSEPVLSPDRRYIAFLRQTGGPGIRVGCGEAEPNQLWVTDVDGQKAMCLVRSAPSEDMQCVLAGLHRPQFSPDGTAVFFLSRAWVTSHAVHRVDVGSGEVNFVCDAGTLEVVPSGEFTGYLIVSQHKYFLGGGSYDWYWLVTGDGHTVACLGPDPSNFRSLYVK